MPPTVPPALPTKQPPTAPPPSVVEVHARKPRSSVRVRKPKILRIRKRFCDDCERTELIWKCKKRCGSRWNKIARDGRRSSCGTVNLIKCKRTCWSGATRRVVVKRVVTRVMRREIEIVPETTTAVSFLEIWVSRDRTFRILIIATTRVQTRRARK